MATLTEQKAAERTDVGEVAHVVCTTCYGDVPRTRTAYCGAQVPADEPWWPWPDGPSPCVGCITTMRCPTCDTAQRMKVS